MRPLRALLVLAAVAGAARRRGKTCVLTISCLNNFAHVLSFFEAARSANPQIDCWAWAIADRPEFYAGASPLLTAEARDAVAALRRALPAYATAVTLDDLQSVADFPLLELAFKYGLVEFNTAIKAHAVTYAFDVLGGAKCLYFDNDVWVLRSLWEIEALLDAASVVVTPHVAEPNPLDGLRQTDTQIGQAGIFNFGFVAFRDAPGARAFLAWWAQRLRWRGRPRRAGCGRRRTRGGRAQVRLCRRGPRHALRPGLGRLRARVPRGVDFNHWFGGSPPNFRTLYFGQIEVDSADFWTNRLLSSSSLSKAEESAP